MAGKCCSSTKFKGAQHFSKSGPLNSLQENIKHYLDWAFLCIGGWIEVREGDHSALKCVACPGYDLGQVWKTCSSNLIWEDASYTDSEGSTFQPIQPVFSPVPDSINYPKGQIIFDSPLPQDADVSGSFSYRCVNVVLGSRSEWWKRFEMGSWSVDDWVVEKNTDCVKIGDDRVQLPAIVISGSSGSTRPKGLGQCNSIKTFNIEFNVLAKTEEDRDKLVGILLEDNGMCKTLFDIDEAPCVYDCNGQLENPMTYPEKLTNFPCGQARIDSSEFFGSSMLECGLFEGIVRHEYEVN